MRIGLLATKKDLYSHRRILEAGTKRGHDMRFIKTTECYVNISDKNPAIHYRGGETIDNIDAIIPRIGASLTFYGSALVRQFEAAGIFTLNDSDAIPVSRDKLRSLQILAKHKLPCPVTGFANSPLDTEDLIEMVGGAPLIIKLLESTQGRGIVLAETKNAAKSVISAFKQLKANIIIQEFIKEAAGSDLRCLVIGNRVYAAMQRTAVGGEFRSNVHMGGSVSEVKITPDERKIAVKAARCMGLDVAGVDLIRSNRGPLVLEVNSSPGIEGIEKATGKDIAGKIIEYIEKNYKEGVQ